MLHLRLKLLYLFPGKLSMFPDCYGIVTVASLLVESVAACKPTSMLKTLLMRGLGPCEERAIGIGGRSPALPCHTTGHAGPHPAVRRVKLTMNSKLGKPERGEVSVRQSDVQRWGLREVPRSIGAARRFRGVLRSDAAFAELSISGGSSFPLFADQDRKSVV